MAPNQRDPDKALVAAWVPKQLKAELEIRAAAEGLTIAQAVTRAVEDWLRPDARP